MGVKRDADQIFTMWNAPASERVPALEQIDMSAQAHEGETLKARAERLRQKTAERLRAFAPSRPRSGSETLRKRFK
jgi:hypothetical protein